MSATRCGRQLGRRRPHGTRKGAMACPLAECAHISLFMWAVGGEIMGLRRLRVAALAGPVGGLRINLDNRAWLVSAPPLQDAHLDHLGRRDRADSGGDLLDDRGA